MSGPLAITSLSIPLRYTYFSKPCANPSAGTSIFYETKPSAAQSHAIWRCDKISNAVTASAYNHFQSPLSSNSFFTDNLPSLWETARDINSQGQVEVTIVKDRLMEKTLTVNLRGQSKLVSECRAKVLQAYSSIELRHIVLGDSLIFDYHSRPNSQKISLNPLLCQYLEDIAEHFQVSIFLTDFYFPSNLSQPETEAVTAQAADYKSYHVLIYGDQDSIRFAEFKLNVFLEGLAGNYVYSLQMDLSKQPLVAGPKLANFEYIMLHTKTKIFTPDWIPNSPTFQKIDNKIRDCDQIYITGNQFQVLMAKYLLQQILNRTDVHITECSISFAKADLLNLRFQEKLRNLMISEGSFIKIPHIGATNAAACIQSSNAGTCKHTTAKLMELTTQFYNATYNVNSDKENNKDKHLSPKVNICYKDLDEIAATSGATITYNDTTFDIIGFKSDTKRAVSMINSISIWKNTLKEVKYRVELSSDHRDFIAGKKNGKITRIMNAASVSIKLISYNQHNFFIDISSENSLSSTTGLKLLEEEIASELAFYIPEAYHKKVIGAGGSTIQLIMRKYNVFIKFSSGFDCNPNGLTNMRSNNVLIRCPTKNAKEIKPAQKELQKTVFDRSQEHANTFVRLTRSHMRILLSQKTGFPFDIENKTNTIVVLPEADQLEKPTSTIEITGVFGTSDTAAQLIKDMLPQDYEFKIASSTRFDMLVNEDNCEFYQKIVVPFRVKLNIEVQVFPIPQFARDEAPYHRVLLSFMSEHNSGLDEAIQLLTAYVRDKGLNIIDRGGYHVDPIVQGTAASTLLFSKAKRQNRAEEKHTISVDLRNSNQSTIESGPKPGFGSRSKKPFITPISTSKNVTQRKTSFNDLPISSPHTSSRVVSATYRDQSAHPYMKLNPKARVFRPSPQNNRLKYQPDEEIGNDKLLETLHMEADFANLTPDREYNFLQQSSNVPQKYLTTDFEDKYQPPVSPPKFQPPLFKFSSSFASPQAFSAFAPQFSIFNSDFSDSTSSLPIRSISNDRTATSDDISFYSPKKGKLLETWSTSVFHPPHSSQMEFPSTVGYTHNQFR